MFMEKIINNKEKILDKDVNNISYKCYFVVIDQYKNVYLMNNYNVYSFPYLYLKNENSSYDEFLNDKFNVISSNLFLEIHDYISDYPMIGENSLYKSFYYLVNVETVFDKMLVKIPFNNLDEVLKNNRYINPKWQEEINKMIKALSYLKEA